MLGRRRFSRIFSRKSISFPLLLVLVLLLMTSCSNGAQESTDSKTIHIYQFKVEISEPLKAMVAEYEKEHPGIKVEVLSVGGGMDYAASLKAKFSSGDEPDIFTNEGYQDMETWFEYLEDLSDQPWVNELDDFAKRPMTKDGKLYGQPMNLEGFGFIYNRDLFEQAGITDLPQTLTELRQVAQRLEEQGIIPFANAYQEYWVLGNHLANIPFSRQEEPERFIEELDAQTNRIPGNPVFDDWVQLMDLMLEYSNPYPLTTDYNTQVTLFATGQAAMMPQGNWTQPQIDGINPDLNIGILPTPVNDDPALADYLAVGVPANWVVNKNSPVKEEAKDFLNWMVTSDTGKRYITEEFKFVPAFQSIKTSPDIVGDLGAEIIRRVEEDKVLSWNFSRFPKGLNHDLSSIMQAYIAGAITKEDMMQQFQEAWDNLKFR